MASITFNKVQYGLESTHGTAVAATKMFPGRANVPRDRFPQYPNENLGLRAPSARSVIYQILADGLNLEAEHGYFQALPMMFSIGLKGGISAAERNVGEGDYGWDFTPSLTASNTPDSITAEVGDDQRCYEVEYLMARRLRVAGRLGEDAPVNLLAECFGKQVSPTTFTPALSLPSQEPMVANLTKLFIDDTWANVGNTQKTGVLREYTWELLTGVHPKFHGDSKMMTSEGEGEFMVLATFTVERGSEADTLYDAYQAQTEKAFRLQIPGSQIGSGDTHILTLDMWGTLEEMVPMATEKDGDNLDTFIFHGFYDKTGAAMFDVDVVTDISAI